MLAEFVFRKRQIQAGFPGRFPKPRMFFAVTAAGGRIHDCYDVRKFPLASISFSVKPVALRAIHRRTAYQTEPGTTGHILRL